MSETASILDELARCSAHMAELLHQPSYAVGLESRHTGRSTLAEMGLAALAALRGSS